LMRRSTASMRRFSTLSSTEREDCWNDRLGEQARPAVVGRRCQKLADCAPKHLPASSYSGILFCHVAHAPIDTLGGDSAQHACESGMQLRQCLLLPIGRFDDGPESRSA
jgi:hypothetical protein